MSNISGQLIVDDVFYIFLFIFIHFIWIQDDAIWLFFSRGIFIT